MRTLKKSLALVLALVMVLGLGVVGASADNKLDDYTDAKDIGDAYVEAVGVMTGLEIVDGMTETTIDPTATYTREQAAKIIAYMVLGKSAADSLTCTVAPFDDVAADRWSAGYISFCVEQGIIDGMTDTTFEPTGTLTGFQWAKMLLSAVGFNAKGEFTGDSWSLNTARVAHSVGLFTGDAAGADHVALQRQQAMLYAFNTLTSVGLVTYSESMGDYFYSYNFGERYTGEGTLGDTVFDLRSVEGIITGSEGMGDKHTVISNSNLKTVANLDAGVATTDAYDMYHAARVWYVGDAPVYNNDALKTAGKGDMVYVNDLAKVESVDCPTRNTTAVKKLNDTVPSSAVFTKNLQIGVSGEDYLYVLVDNTALGAAYGYAGVTYNMDDLKLGARSNNKDQVMIGSDKVKNDNIWTDISEISKGSEIIVLKTKDKVDDAVYYVYATTGTTGAVTKYESNGTITLSDGTKLTPSVFNNYTVDTAVVKELVAALHDSPATAPNYYFVLDTHGHYISFTNNGFKTVAYYTSAWKNPNHSDNWSTDQEYIAQFVDVATGEVEEIPVTADWHAWAKEGGYYDITDELYGNETYEPEQVFVAGNDTTTSYGEYRYVTAPTTFNASTYKVGNYYFNNETVTYVIVSGAGDNLDVDVWTGNDGLLEGYAEKYDLDANSVKSVTLEKMALLTSDNTGNNESVSVIFAYDTGRYVNGGIAFFPKDVTGWAAVDHSYVNVMAYLNGAKVDKEIPVSDESYNKGIKAGFYSYTIDDQTGIYTLTPIKASEWGLILDESDIREADGKYWIEAGNVDYDLAADTPVIDLRTDPESKIESVAELADTDFNDAFNTYAEVAYVVDSNNNVLYIYLVDANYYTVTASKGVTNLQISEPTLSDEEVSVWAPLPKTVTVTLTKTGGSWSGVNTITVEINGNEVVYTKDAVVNGFTVDATDNYVTFTVEVDCDTDIVIGNYA